jgi:hypothetical protein
VAGDVVTAGPAGTGVTQAADGQPEQHESKPVLPSEQGGVAPRGAVADAGADAPRADPRRPANPRPARPRPVSYTQQTLPTNREV